MSLADKTVTGAFWSYAEQLSMRGISVLVTLLLAKFLAPSDFGLMAMLAIFIAVANSVMESGFKQALIRKQKATQEDFSTAFYVNLLLGGLAYVLLFSAAPLIANFYKEPRLVTLVRVVGVVILINAFQIIQVAILNRALDFKTQMKASVPATSISGFVAIVIAYFGFGVWALVGQIITSAFLLTAFLWYLVKWHPSLIFNRQSFIEMYGFGSKLFISELIEITFNNIYIVVIAKIFSSTIAGFYFFAVKIRDLLVQQLTNSIQAATFPALSQIQDDDEQLKAGFRKVIQVITFFLFPIMALLAALANPIFHVVLPEKWYPSAWYLQLLCLAGLMYPLHAMNRNILKVKGRSDIFLFLEIYKKTIVAIVLLISLQFGIKGILVGQIITSVVNYVPGSYFSGKLIGYSISEQIGDFLPTLLLSGIVSFLVYCIVLFIAWQAILQVITFGCCGFVLYFTGCYLLKIEGYKLVVQIIRDRMSGLTISLS